MTTPAQWLKLAAKLGVLTITAGLLIATSASPDCSQRSAPVAFRTTGTCGPGGLIVVEPDNDNSSVTVANAAALGLPPLDPPGGSVGRYRGKACPFTLDQGEWDFEWQGCGDTGGAVMPDGGPGAVDAGGMSCLHRCEAHRSEGGQLLFTCTDTNGAVLCESRLMRLESP